MKQTVKSTFYFRSILYISYYRYIPNISAVNEKIFDILDTISTPHHIMCNNNHYCFMSHRLREGVWSTVIHPRRLYL